jgi:Uma2 family endonuclease
MVQTVTKFITLADFLSLPETKPASEFIDGRIVSKPMPQGKHSTIQGELVSAINTVLKSHRSRLSRITLHVWRTIYRARSRRVCVGKDSSR